MKAPLRTSTKIAEKLRAWLASELEPHEINNIDQYAHHVVTIFLNEDLDIEDEPLSPVTDYLNDLFSLRTGKSLDKKKRAAVQFLKGVISCDRSVSQTEIERIIDELIVRIEATKENKPSPRKLLGPITLNVNSSGCRQRNRIEQERRYNEAFPSLSGDIERSNRAVSLVTKKGACAEALLKSPINKENSHGVEKQLKFSSGSARSITFLDKSEASACLTAGLVFVFALSDRNFPSPDAMEVDESSFEAGTFSSWTLQSCYETCWKSAFQPVNSTKLFSPQRNCLPVQHNLSTVKSKCKKVVTTNSLDRLSDRIDLFNEESPKVFLHVEHKSSRPPEEILFALDPDDLEVSNIISWALINQEQVRQRREQMNRRRKNDAKVQQKGRTMVTCSKRSCSQSDQCRQNWNNEDGCVPLCPDVPKMEKDRISSESTSEDNSPLLGAVGGCTESSSEEVKTDDVVSFALQQLAKYEMDRSSKDVDVKHRSNVGIDDVLEITIPEINHGKMDCGPRMEAGNDKSVSTCTSRGKLGSIDSGMYPGGEEDCGAGNIFEERNASSTSLLGSVDTANAGLKPYSRPHWRKTPGCCTDSSEEDTVTIVSGGEVGGVDENDRCTTRWDEWRDPLPIPGSSWEGMIQKDIFNISSPLIDSNDTVLHSTTIFQPPELSSCANDNVAQILQSAYVNSIFAKGVPLDPVAQIENSSVVLNCADLERSWLFTRSETHPNSSNSLDVIRGKTCSSWLEGYCDLGIGCPFSHPSI